MKISEITSRKFSLLGRDFEVTVNNDSMTVLESEAPFYIELTIWANINDTVEVKYDILGWDSEQEFARTTDDLEEIYLQALTLYKKDVKEAVAEAKSLEITLGFVHQARADKVLKNVEEGRVTLNDEVFKVDRWYLRNYIFEGPEYSFLYFVSTGVFTDKNLENEYKELDLEKAAQFYKELHEKN